jgi:sulfur carrier protein
MFTVCGKEVQLDEIGLGEYLDSNGYNRKTIAVECNEEMVPRAEFDSFVIHSGDVVEIVSFMGGGSCKGK